MISYHNLKLHGWVGTQIDEIGQDFPNPLDPFPCSHATLDMAALLFGADQNDHGIPSGFKCRNRKISLTRTGQFDTFQFKIVFTAGR